MKKKYLCVAGYVFSSDGGRHYIPAYRLPRLYKINFKKCEYVRYSENEEDFNPDLIRLYPKADGKYVLPILESMENICLTQADKDKHRELLIDQAEDQDHFNSLEG